MTEEFTNNYLKLTPSERFDIGKSVNSELRFFYLTQVSESLVRKINSSDYDQMNTYIRRFLVAIIFDNFEFDYRETFLRLNSLFLSSKKYKIVFIEEIEKIIHIAFGKAKDFLYEITIFLKK